MWERAHKKAYAKLEKEGDRWAVVLYSALAITMYRNWGMKTTAVTRLIDVTWDAWRECAQDHDHSMIQMCETETGIEIRNGDGSGWRDVAYLNGQDMGRMTDAQWLYMRQQQIKWIRPNIMACILIGLHRKYGFGYERCLRVYQQIQEIEQEFGDNAKRIKSKRRESMGIADAFSREDRIEIKVESFIRMTQTAAKAEAQRDMLMNAVNCEVTYRYIREMMTGIKEGPPELFTINVDRDAINGAVNSLVGKEESNEEFPE